MSKKISLSHGGRNVIALRTMRSLRGVLQFGEGDRGTSRREPDWVNGSGFGVGGLGIGDWGLGLGFRVQGSEFRVSGFGFRV